MGFLEVIGGSVSGAFKSVMEKNRKAALMNRIKIVMETETQNADKAYIALGKYYYQNLRDETNGDTELYCAAVDNANRRLTRAASKLAALSAPGAAVDEDIVCEVLAEDGCPTAEEAQGEDPWEPMSVLSPEEDVLDGDAATELKAEADDPAKEAADESDDEVVPWT